MFESLRKESRRWLKLLRADDTAAWARYRAALPQGEATPTLREVQLALARERGFAGWQQLKESIEMAAAAQRSRQELATEMLRHMTWHGEPPIGARLLKQHPALATHDFFTAVATGNFTAVQQQLATDPAAATRPGGPLNWEPILYLAYSRLPGHDGEAMEIARLLFDHGANAAARWVDPWNNPFTLITGVIAQGEGVKPPHPRADGLVELFITQGADPYDTQSFYNTSIVGDDPHWLEVLWTACAARGITGKWLAVPPTSFTGKTPVNQLDYLLGNAVAYNHKLRAAWLLERGAVATHTHAYSGHSLLEEALVHGHLEVADLLRQHGAPEVTLSPPVAFQVACLRLEGERAHAMVSAMPQLLQHAEPLLAAARQGRKDVISLLLDLGVPVDIANDHGMRALQLAVASDARDVVQLLLERGSEVDRPTKHYGGGMGFAAHFGRRECGALLAPHSRDVHNMVHLGPAFQGRLEELFREDPQLVNRVHFRLGVPPLFTLPEDETEAVAMARFLLAHGADMLARNKERLTAGEQARRRGQDSLAKLLGS